MRNLFKTTLLVLALLVPAIAMAEIAYDFEVDGVYYKIFGNTACVSYKDYSYISRVHYYASDYKGDVTIPATVEHDGKTYPVTSIRQHAFHGCGSLESITIPASITSIGIDAFEGCRQLARVNITDIAAWCGIDMGYEYANPLMLAHHLYMDGAEVTDLAIPETVTSIADGAFMECYGLKHVTIPNTVTAIGSAAFQYCSGLTSIDVPNSVITMGSDAFACCTGLTRVTLGNSLSSISGYAFYECTGLTSIDVPNSVKSIGGNAFYGCTALKDINIPDQVTGIGGFAFYGCTALSSVSIGKSVATIGRGAFGNAPAIETVTCKATTPPSWYNSTDMFMPHVLNHAALHVPVGFERAYMTDPNWGKFVNITGDVIQDDPMSDDDYLKCDVNGDGEVNISDVNKVIEAIQAH